MNLMAKSMKELLKNLEDNKQKEKYIDEIEDRENEDSNYIVEFDFVKADPVAHIEFCRISFLLRNRLNPEYSSTINRYCIKFSEFASLLDMKRELQKSIKQLESSPNRNWNTYQSLQASFTQISKLHNTCSNQLLNLEKTLGITPSSSARLFSTQNSNPEDGMEELFLPENY